ncbi:MAG: DNA-formamidopyrimidine glycosylase family protein [Actinomycetota bacterium]
MPEGDTVWRTARQLDEALAGRVLTATDFRVPRYAAADLTGQAVTEAIPRGKHLLIRTDQGQSIHSHLKMDGSWRIRKAGGPAPRDYRVRVVLANNDWQAVGSLLSLVEVLATSDEDRVVGHLGPDLLGPDWDTAEAVRRLQHDPARPAGEAILDQRNLAGIGNVYKCEVLFLRGISPWRPVGEIANLEALATLSRRLLDANKNRHGHITTGNLRRGAQHYVYGRRGLPCRRCGTPVRYDDGKSGGREDRITYWCPSCQPG